MIDWAKLVQKNRAKAIGVPWTEEELKAIYTLSIPADYVREGIITISAYEEAKGNLEIKSKETLLKEAKDKGLVITDEAPKEVIEKELSKLGLEELRKLGKENKIKGWAIMGEAKLREKLS